MHECETMTGVSTQEEADTLMIHHAVEVASNGVNVLIYSQDMDVLLFALRIIPLICDHSAAIMSTAVRRGNVFLQPNTYGKLGPDKSGALTVLIRQGIGTYP